MKDIEQSATNYVEPVFRFCLKRLNSRHDAEDLAQEIMVHVISGISRNDVKNIDGWVWQVAHNRYARFIHFRAKKEGAELADETYIDEQDDYDLVDDLIVRQEHRAVFTALHTLSSAYRNIVVDHYVNELPLAAISKKYDLPLTTVKWRLHVGRDQIRERMNHMERVYERINWNTTTCNGSMDSDRYLHSQVARAICLAAYEKPVTTDEISMATGLPAMYIEDEMPNLIFGDAIIQTGLKYSTNFIILRLTDSEKMIKEFAPYVTEISETITRSFHDNKEKVKEIGFYGSDFGMDKLGYVILPMILRRAKSSDKLKSGPYPPRKDGGYGWFIVSETEGKNEGPAPTESGNNSDFDAGRHEKGIISYLWLGKYFSRDLYQGMGWVFGKNLMQKIKDGTIPDGLLTDDEMANLIRLNLITKDKTGYKIAFPIFTNEQFDRLVELFRPLIVTLRGMLNDLVVKILDEFHKNTPKQVQDQINQYVSGYIHNIIGFVAFDMIEKGVLEPPPKEGPLSDSVLFITSVPDRQI